VPSSDLFLNPAEAARQLGVSTKALRLYEAHGLLAPVRSAARWRAYGPEQMARARRIAALRAIGLGLAQIATVLDDGPERMEAVLATHQRSLGAGAARLAEQITATEALRKETPVAIGAPAIAFDLPWPWAGERFALPELKPLTYIVGSLGSGKTRLARLLAETLPDAYFLGPDRIGSNLTAADAPGEPARIETLPPQPAATDTLALHALLTAIAAPKPSAFVIDMVEDGLDAASQRALISHLRHGRSDRRPLFLMTRSTAILDLARVGDAEAIIFCPANHSPPMLVKPDPGSRGFEALRLCLASPAARARLAAGPQPSSSPLHVTI